jgi:catechol 2,3-dioxygenase-like lactoylglutathione lyase family enzyme
MDPMSVGVTRALHCNLNVRDVAAAAAVYRDALGLRVVMRSRPVGADSSVLGLDAPTDSRVWFLYDHRGGRVGPAIELVQWDTPATIGSASSNPADVGMRALGFRVPSVAAAADRIQAAGGERTARASSFTDAVARDADGVDVDLVAAGHAERAATMAHVRLNCGGLERTTQWYEALGLRRAGGVDTEVWTEAPDAYGREAVPVQRLTFGDRSGFELRLTTWPGTSPTARARQAANHRGLFRMAFAVDDVDAAVATARRHPRLEAADPEYLPLPGTPVGGLRVAFLCDPDGVTVELVERPEE